MIVVMAYIALAAESWWWVYRRCYVAMVVCIDLMG